MEDLFQEIYIKHSLIVRRIVFRMVGSQEGNDVVQDTFIKVFKNIDSFKGNSSLQSWICSIAINTAKDHLKSKKRFSWLLFFDFFKPEHESHFYHENHFERDSFEKIIDKMPIKLKEVIILYSIEELQVKEISSILKIPEGTVKSRLSLGRKFLSDYLKKEGGFS